MLFVEKGLGNQRSSVFCRTNSLFSSVSIRVWCSISWIYWESGSTKGWWRHSCTICVMRLEPKLGGLFLIEATNAPPAKIGGLAPIPA